MPRRKIPGGTAEAANAAPIVGSSPYDGPAGPVRGLLKNLVMKDNKNGVPMFKFLVEVTEPVGSPKAKHNGQTLRGQQNLSAESSGWVNGLLIGIGVPPADQKTFWTTGVNVEKADLNGNEKVLSIGKWKPAPGGVPVVVVAKLSDGYTNAEGAEVPASMQATSFLVATGDASGPADEQEDEDLIGDDELADADPGEEEEAEENDEEEAEDDPFEARTNELEELAAAGQRMGLVKIAKAHGLTVLKSHNEDAIINMILDAEFGASEEESDEEEAEEVEEETPEPEPTPAPKAARTTPKRAATKAPPF